MQFNPIYEQLFSKARKDDSFFDSQSNQGQDFDYTPSESFDIAGTNPKNAFYSLSETDKMRYPGGVPGGLGPIQQMRRMINDSVINVGNTFGQDWSQQGLDMGNPYSRNPQKAKQQMDARYARTKNNPIDSFFLDQTYGKGNW